MQISTTMMASLVISHHPNFKVKVIIQGIKGYTKVFAGQAHNFRLLLYNSLSTCARCHKQDSCLNRLTFRSECFSVCVCLSILKWLMFFFFVAFLFHWFGKNLSMSKPKYQINQFVHSCRKTKMAPDSPALSCIFPEAPMIINRNLYNL